MFHKFIISSVKGTLKLYITIFWGPRWEGHAIKVKIKLLIVFLQNKIFGFYTEICCNIAQYYSEISGNFKLQH